MSFSYNLLKKITKLYASLIRLVFPIRGVRILAETAQQLVPVIDVTIKNGVMKFYGFGALTEYRARTFFTKEPETVEWIDSFSHGEIMWDIGANIGIYSVYAATRGVNVVAFEPAFSNYFLLCKNVEINGMSAQVSPLCLALCGKTGFDYFYMSSTDLGSALHNFGASVDEHGQPMVESFRQASLGFSMDDFFNQFNLPVPHHIKIDVDGLESEILRGGQSLFSNAELKSVLIEMDSSNQEKCKADIDFLESQGLKFVRKAHGLIFEEGDFKDFYNYIFQRNPL